MFWLDIGKIFFYLHSKKTDSLGNNQTGSVQNTPAGNVCESVRQFFEKERNKSRKSFTVTFSHTNKWL